ncbi:MAG: hypothetical protein GF398_11690 [Chitinivibrionales bacterium]|nr:hypothetical protein [Chitinivibrionales bacterium]
MEQTPVQSLIRQCVAGERSAQRELFYACKGRKEESSSAYSRCRIRASVSLILVLCIGGTAVWTVRRSTPSASACVRLQKVGGHAFHQNENQTWRPALQNGRLAPGAMLKTDASAHVLAQIGPSFTSAAPLHSSIHLLQAQATQQKVLLAGGSLARSDSIPLSNGEDSLGDDEAETMRSMQDEHDSIQVGDSIHGHVPTIMPMLSGIKSPHGKDSVAGRGKGIQGRLGLSVLRIPGSSAYDAWLDEELIHLAVFISEHTKLKVHYQKTAFHLDNIFVDFAYWQRQARRRGISGYRGLNSQALERSALEELGNAVPFARSKDYLQFLNRIDMVLKEYFHRKYNVRFDPAHPNWVKQLPADQHVIAWQREFLPRAEADYRSCTSSGKLSGKEIRAIYQYLRMAEILTHAMLFCDVPGVPGHLSQENTEVLTWYLESGGFIYFMNTNDLQSAMGIRAIIARLQDEKLMDTKERDWFERWQPNERIRTGYSFGPPRPAVFHPWTFVPMSVAEQTDVLVTIRNRHEDIVFTDTLHNLQRGSYNQRLKHYRWYAEDNRGREVPSGLYLMQFEAGLSLSYEICRVSRLRRLMPNHRLFNSFFAHARLAPSHQPEPEQLLYAEPLIFASEINDRLAILFTDGYREDIALQSVEEREFERIAAQKWMTNIVFQVLNERASIRK